MNQMFSKYWCDALSISSLTRATAGRSSTFLVTKQTVRNALLSAIGSAVKSGWIPAVVAKRDMIETPMPTSTRFCVAQKSSVECVISGVKPAARANDTRFAWQVSQPAIHCSLRAETNWTGRCELSYWRAIALFAPISSISGSTPKGATSKSSGPAKAGSELYWKMIAQSASPVPTPPWPQAAPSA